jgi:hypothetical protein
MHTLTEAEFRLEAEPFLRQVFINDDQFDQPFLPNIVGRRIIYPCGGYIAPPLINAVITAAANLGDTGCYISLLKTSASVEKPNHCYIPLLEFLEGYAGTPRSEQLIGVRLGMNPYGSESVIYSASGKWGILQSYEQYGLLGGSLEFIEEIRRSVPDLDEQVYGFLDRLRGLLLAAGIDPSDGTRNE